ncbi:MAG: sulfate adenylyltransferase subunit CysN [Pseudomonadota bacterium]|jgi:sulfate adenylyltransferase subunit 1|uniref:sulfate adenylyltransferase subunit CysN n=1 Tax=Marisediminitalea TaxID=2662254 RepID=UPI000C5429F6|nr:sulfate adenylyltransferase subunit CysN [Marisediminitalea aggregata]MBL54194.1 sulfate adenylyltransferase subunit CysN [Alteromonadaceae bacterium]MCP4235220.1 sulfate adenylyltransferase subunit CysN [Aestuariibacter sp.]MEC7825081.1 sulfate adenylyltransferase subunit CysN [Pseudomonadota bacterium]MCP4528177.1 sulfate adenylyltransferase subunit CysN [Aestuariibacter sp.]MCP4945944.1 sulfate adenylyltransferase subunit CysN [Aestuariibacter sp.]|tara:strand:- start:1932 stop:3347 length:1416 start_codon:yes stop_codon:yes gene_type:complete
MNNENELLKEDILSYLDQHEHKDLLRFLTCGSVDDGKSTLIGRLLHDSKMIYEDQLAAITQDSKKVGTTGDKVDLALLVDGLQSEREQGITIDVAYRYFSTDKRKFIIADTPGHEQYTRNMVTGASTCDLAILMVDARAGVKTQTRRHSFLVSLLGIKHVIVAVNKMDLMKYSEEVYKEIQADYKEFAKQLDIPDIHFVPISALEGDNVVNLSEHTPWYDGKTLMEMLESIEINKDANTDDFRFPVQYVNRPNLDFRGFAGTVVSGQIKPGDDVTALPSGKTSKVKQVVTFDGDLEEAYAPLAVTLTLEDEIDISRGDMIVKSDNKPLLSTQFKTHLVWMAEEPMMPNKQYMFKFATKTTPGSVAAIDHLIDVNTLEHSQSLHMNLNEIGVVDVKFTQPVPCDPYKRNRATGAFIVIDRLTNGTVGAGMIIDELAKDKLHGATEFSAFELEFNELVRKHFPHWNAIDISKL